MENNKKDIRLRSWDSKENRYWNQLYTKDWEYCTGIKDKNGKLIYEGDYLKWETGEITRVTFVANEARFDFGENVALVAEFAEIAGDIHKGVKDHK